MGVEGLIKVITRTRRATRRRPGFAKAGHRAGPVQTGFQRGRARPGAAARLRSALQAACVGACLLATVPGPAAAGLVDQLQRGETVTVVALGDSLAAGYELARPASDAYPVVFQTLLQRRYPKAHIHLVSAGVPGDTAARGGERLASDVLQRQPDLVTIQFGGNDHGRRRPPDEFRRDLETMVRRIREATAAAVILATPPIAEQTPDTPMVRAVKDVGAALQVPVADFDGALRQAGVGARTSFPLGRHPTARMHAVMGIELYQAFCRLIGDAASMRVGIETGTREVAAGSRLDVKVFVKAHAPGPVAVSLERDGAVEHRRVVADRNGRATASFSVPTAGIASKTRQHRLIAWARQGTGFACDLRWLSLAPVLTPGNLEGTLGGDRVVLGAREWRGPDDLSARFWVAYQPDLLAVTVVVRDDRVERSFFAGGHQSDGVEVYLDLRPPAAQGHPYWGEGVVGLCFQPPVDERDEASWSSLEPLPAGWKPQMIRGTLRPDGYEITARLPLAALWPQRAARPATVGFDLAVNDADDRWGRQTQMVWAGGADDYLDPSLYAALSLYPEAGARPRVRGVIR